MAATSADGFTSARFIVDGAGAFVVSAAAGVGDFAFVVPAAAGVGVGVGVFAFVVSAGVVAVAGLVAVAGVVAVAGAVAVAFAAAGAGAGAGGGVVWASDGSCLTSSADSVAENPSADPRFVPDSAAFGAPLPEPPPSI